MRASYDIRFVRIGALAASLLFLSTCNASAQSHFGDLDLNGTWDVRDVAIALSYALGMTEPTPQQRFRADVAPVNPDGWFGDGAVTVEDAARIFYRALGLEPAEPWPERRVIVSYQDGISDEQSNEIHGRITGTDSGATFAKCSKVLGMSGVYVGVLKPGLAVDEAETAVRRSAAVSQLPNAVRYVEPDRRVWAFETPNDPDYQAGDQWYLDDIGAPAAWDISLGSSSVVVALVDTGVDTSHPDVGSKVIDYADFVGDGLSGDPNGHGTHVAGIAAAITNNAIGIAGMAWNCNIIAARVLDSKGGAGSAQVAAGVNWVASWAAQHASTRVVANMSLGSDAETRTMQAAIQQAAANGVVMTVAAGNDGASIVEYPAADPLCIAVGATTRDDQIASFSDWGSWIHIAAPGVGIFSTLPVGSSTIGAEVHANSYGQLSGTSMASPIVAGLAALILSVDPTLTPDEVRSTIESTADPIAVSPPITPIAKVNAAKALQSLKPATPQVVLGDLNGDGTVEVADAVVALQFAVGIGTPTPAQVQAGDLNGDGSIDVADVLLILWLALGLGLPSAGG